jgi:isoleucyl-tRNA synthetase
MKFPNLEQKPDFPKIEENILSYWDSNDTFTKSLNKNKGEKEFIFYDGPPFATGLPHHGHLIQGAIKDLIPRYYTMKGFYVERRFGWDCHGLPVEYELEKIKGIKNKKEIESLGIDNFNEECRLIVLKYVNEWKDFVKRMGRWVDMENDYKTMDKDYMESIWYIFKTIYDKGLIYEGYRSIKICPRCATPLSNTEVQLGYKDLEDLSIVAKFKLIDEKNTYILAWTTTPWTLPANVLLAINKDIDYVKVKSNGEYFILAKDRVDYIFENMDYEIIEKVKISNLIGKRYEPLFDISKTIKIEHVNKGWYIAPAEFVTSDEGTGIVHIAPAFGEEDMLLGKELDTPNIKHVNIEGEFGEYPLMEWAGEQARDLGEKIIDQLKKDHTFFREIRITHSYPHCWRCDTPLLNYSMDSWFLKVKDIKKETVKNNELINWIPKYIKHGRFKKGLESAPDWGLSRNRYWGTPLPVWKCDNCSNTIVIGSIKELEDLSEKKNITDIHRHFIDDIEFKCEECKKGSMKRIPEVLDCWFESGSMPYAQKHYPFENKENFEKNFPASFIAEAIDQTRGWFYSLHTISTAFMDNPAFLNVITTGIILDSTGKKLSKSKRNYTDPIEIVNEFGADALKFYLLSSPIVKGDDLMFKDEGVSNVVKNVFLTIYNTLKYFTIYANSYDFDPKEEKSSNVLDQWIISRTNKLISQITKYLDNYNLMDATMLIQPYIDELSTWYIRRSRQRFAEGDFNSLNTLYTVLIEFAKTTAPITPFLSEYIFMSLNKTTSVHLENYPTANIDLINTKLEEEMNYAREIISELQNLRIENSIKLKQPVREIYIGNNIIKNKSILDIIKDELNAKNIIYTKNKNLKINIGKYGEIGINTNLDKEMIEEGLYRELIREIQNLRKNKKLNINNIIIFFFYNTAAKK